MISILKLLHKEGVSVYVRALWLVSRRGVIACSIVPMLDWLADWGRRLNAWRFVQTTCHTCDVASFVTGCVWISSRLPHLVWLQEFVHHRHKSPWVVLSSPGLLCVPRGGRYQQWMPGAKVEYHFEKEHMCRPRMLLVKKAPSLIHKFS